MSRKLSSYLKHGRLGEVIALIQVLAYHRNTSRSEDGLRKELCYAPISAISWIEVAKNHPELFRVRLKECGVDRVSLVSRYVLLYSSENNKRIRAPLDPSVVNKLIEIAVELHDKEAMRAERWKVWVPVVAALVSAGAAVSAAFLRNDISPTPPSLASYSTQPQTVSPAPTTTLCTCCSVATGEEQSRSNLTPTIELPPDAFSARPGKEARH